LSTTQVVYNGETFELGSEEARIIYTALKELGRSGNAVTDGYVISSSTQPVGSSVSAGQLFVTSSDVIKNMGGNGTFDVVCIKK
jgi:hypothetical protein